MIRTLALALTLTAGAAIAQPADGPTTALTIYSTAAPGAIDPSMYRPTPGQNAYNPNRYGQIPGYAVIKDQRKLTLAAGIQQISFTDVAALLDPTTVRFESLTDPAGTSVLEQDYRFDLLSMDKMLQRYIGEDIFVHNNSVKLLSVTGGGMLYQSDDSGRITFQQGFGGVSFGQIADGLILEPTLVWMLNARLPGTHDTRITYQTTGITWWADYNIVYTDGDTENSGTVDVGAWASILNQSGGTYENAKLKLIAGDVHRAQPNRQVSMEMMRGMVMSDARMAKGFEEKSFFEYHLYTLGRPTTIPDNSTKQIELFPPARGVPAEKILIYDGSAGFRYYGQAMTDRAFGTVSNSKVEVFLSFINDEDAGLGVPLPAGRIRVSKLDPADGTLEFIGEDVIDHTPRNEKVIIKLGNAFDVVGERVQTDFFLDSGRKTITETIKITLRNRKDKPVKVIAAEHLYRWSGWKITRASEDYDKIDSRTIHFAVTLAPDEERTITYTVRYTW